jgi:hypothetical protein
MNAQHLREKYDRHVEKCPAGGGVAVKEVTLGK